MINGVPGLGNVVELAEVVRNEFVESRHFGLAVALDPDGKQVFAAGDVDEVVLPRSTAKPLQAVGCIVAGAEKVRMNCSGKHAAMLKAAVAQGDDPVLYLDPHSTVQRTITAEIERLTESSTGIVTVDGCGAPLLGMPLSGLARAFSHLATAPAGTADSQVAAAMRKYPELVGGKGHQNTEVMRLLPGVIAKGGAEGVIAMATPDGHAVAVKVIDGNPRATTALALTLLQKCGVNVSPATTLINLPVLGGGKPVGEIRPTI